MTADDKGHMFVGTGGKLNWPDVSSSLRGFRSYFTIDLTKNSGAKIGMSASLVDSDSTTGINPIENGQWKMENFRVQKLIEQGKVVVVSNGVRYDLSGRTIK